MRKIIVVQPLSNIFMFKERLKIEGILGDFLGASRSYLFVALSDAASIFHG
jgi:hypothetical protein